MDGRDKRQKETWQGNSKGGDRADSALLGKRKDRERLRPSLRFWQQHRAATGRLYGA